MKNTILEMTSQRLGATAVLDETGALIGIITDGDLRRMLSKDLNLTQFHAEDVMSKTPQTIDSELLAVEALRRMREKSITQLVVTEGGRYVGMVHLHDLLREGLI